MAGPIGPRPPFEPKALTAPKPANALDVMQSLRLPMSLHQEHLTPVLERAIEAGFTAPFERNSVVTNSARVGEGYVVLQRPDGALLLIGFAEGSTAHPMIVLDRQPPDTAFFGFRLGELATIMKVPPTKESVSPPANTIPEPMGYWDAHNLLKQRIDAETAIRPAQKTSKHEAETATRFAAMDLSSVQAARMEVVEAAATRIAATPTVSADAQHARA